MLNFYTKETNGFGAGAFVNGGLLFSLWAAHLELPLLVCGSVSSCLRPHGLQHTRLPCPSLSPGVCSIHVHWVGDAIQPSRPLWPPSPPSVFPSIRVFSNVSALHIRWPNYWSFSISPSNECSGLVSFRIDWFDIFKWLLCSDTVLSTALPWTCHSRAHTMLRGEGQSSHETLGIVCLISKWWP